MQESVKFAVRLDDGTVAILTFLTLGRGNILPYGAQWLDQQNGYWRREANGPNVAHEISRAYAVGAQPVGYRRITDDQIPKDRTFRDALVDDGSQLTHDIAKARVLHLDRVRRARATRLEELDRDWMRATGQGKKADADGIEAKRQELRDLPVMLKVEEATTIEDLKGRWHPDLG